MSTTENEPAYVNLQSTVVMVPGPDKRNVTIHPWRHRNTREGGGLFVVRGSYWQQYVSGAGPLYPFPGDRRWLEQPGMAQGRGVDPGRAFEDAFPDAPSLEVAAKTGGALAPSADRGAGSESSATKEAIYAKIRQQLSEIGVRNAKEFSQSPAAVLLQATHINESNIARLREDVAALFPEDAPAPEPEPAPEPVSEDDDVPLLTYSKAAVEAMTKKELIEVIDEANFDILIGRRTKADLLHELLSGLEDYDMLGE